MKKILLVMQGAAMPKHKPSEVKGQLFLSLILFFFFFREGCLLATEVQMYSIIIKFSKVCILNDQVLQTKKKPKHLKIPQQIHVKMHNVYIKMNNFLLRYRSSNKKKNLLNILVIENEKKKLSSHIAAVFLP